MLWRKLNNSLHRDVGYFFFGMTIIYGLSGIALNHIDDWDPSYIIRNEKIIVDPDWVHKQMSREEVKGLLNELDINESLKDFYYPDAGTLKVFLKGGSLTIGLDGNSGTFESVKRRQVFFQVNYLHYNNPKFLWTYFSDIFGGALIFMACTGIFVLQGKKGLPGRGKWFVAAGLVIPLIFLLLYL
jgi:hypothetical protein